LRGLSDPPDGIGQVGVSTEHYPDSKHVVTG
jgi:hypothetical protein